MMLVLHVLWFSLTAAKYNDSLLITKLLQALILSISRYLVTLVVLGVENLRLIYHMCVLADSLNPSDLLYSSRVSAALL